MRVHDAADAEHACAASCLCAEESMRMHHDILQNGDRVTGGERIVHQNNLIKNILFFVLKMNKVFKGLGQHEGE